MQVARSNADGFAFDVSLHLLRLRTEHFCHDACRYLDTIATTGASEAGRKLGLSCLQLASVASEIKSDIRQVKASASLQRKLSETSRNIEVLLNDEGDGSALDIPEDMKRELSILGSMLSDIFTQISKQTEQVRPGGADLTWDRIHAANATCQFDGDAVSLPSHP